MYVEFTLTYNSKDAFLMNLGLVGLSRLSFGSPYFLGSHISENVGGSTNGGPHTKASPPNF